MTIFMLPFLFFDSIPKIFSVLSDFQNWFGEPWHIHLHLQQERTPKNKFIILNRVKLQYYWKFSRKIRCSGSLANSSKAVMKSLQLTQKLSYQYRYLNITCALGLLQFLVIQQESFEE